MERNELHPKDYSEHPLFPERMERKDKHHPGAVLIPLLLTSCFGDLRLL